MIAAAPLIGLTLTLILTPYIAGRMKRAGITGRDIHKMNQPEVAEMGGMAVLLTIPIALSPFMDEKIMGVLTVFLLFGVAGIIDDLTNLRQLHKVFLSLLVSVPVAFFGIAPEVDLFGYTLNLGVLYPVFAVLFVTGSANLVNMLAGFNGLEVGTSTIILGILALITDGNARLIALTGMGAALGFLWWNRYPARVFPGDTGTLSLGALIGLVALTGKVEAYAALLLLPHFLDFAIKAVGVRFGVRRHGRTTVLPDGTLRAPPYPSFLGIIMRKVRVTEPRLVAIVWLIELTLGLLVWALHQLL
ncbi:MraY family glycosyltransferase [Thermococcus thioreducens]|uniref:UDP-N-acetylglucosamine--dolichyl-phosphate N-acetylglucosaminephosphotransferase n=1 Tax=Thermococcus thioreducens TaxID=277988 RepID=A0A0Q2RC45_9EURY|nr:glycosyltransferase 4 family protein [Thermococcus thioreducens]ASJ13193.1 UDP-N-acetylglucosamine--dolichyl-phosphate N-acetylglucosaminephosphotransferase [Thermococcus thioreducens]KQH81510.1 UDP-N-acetylglucosamine--dolichyl-phosphate N-acetylglucosaminephosphotransferase [Thermococcus thioreducens]SEW20774.1 UDP-N-acetylglucosamine--dolichyl-phosphate N-acetylglucosaminephosphotransferase [Thermococcus thioreducens]